MIFFEPSQEKIEGQGGCSKQSSSGSSNSVMRKGDLDDDGQPQAHPKASLAQTLCQSSFSRCKFGAMGRAPRGLLNLRLHCKNAIVTVWEKTGEGSAGPGHGWPKFLGEDQGPGPRVGQRLATGLSQGCRAKGWPRAGQRSKPRVQVSGPKDRSRPRAGVRCQGHGQRPPRPLGPPIFTRLVDVY